MRLPERDNRPSALLWLAGVASLVLPILGVGSVLYGLYLGASSGPAGWYWVGAGVAIVAADMLLDVLWARTAGSRSDEPDLNRRGAELVGQVVIVVDAIEPGGRGTVRAADTIWAAEGCLAAPGDRVRVTGVKGTVLTVEAI
jgi:membrane protein implicated in regulation of membrane protease activity